MKKMLIVVCVFLSGCAAYLSPTVRAIGEITTQQRSGVGMNREDWVVAGDDHQAALANLSTWAARRRIVIHFQDGLISDGHGVYLGRSRCAIPVCLIEIATSVPGNTQLTTLIHEMAHVFQRGDLSVGQAEIFAELVSYQVSQRLGLNVRVETTLYLYAHFSDEQFLWTTGLSYAPEIDAVVNMLTAAAKGGF